MRFCKEWEESVSEETKSGGKKTIRYLIRIIVQNMVFVKKQNEKKKVMFFIGFRL